MVFYCFMLYFTGVPAKRNVITYDCCPNNPFIDITYTIKIRRRKLYYVVNIIIPCLMLAALTLVTFTIPPDAGEKISFGKFVEISWYLRISQEEESSLFLIEINCKGKHSKTAWAGICCRGAVVQLLLLPWPLLLLNRSCLIEVRAMVVAVQQPPAEYTAIFTVCIV